MTMTRDIILDLLPVYHAGEASSDTRKLVEEFLAQDPELARIAEKSQVRLDSLPTGLPAGQEMKALERTRSLLARRSVFLALSSVFTALPLSFAKIGSGPTWWMWRDAPDLAGVSLAIGASFWVAYFLTRRRLRTTLL